MEILQQLTKVEQSQTFQEWKAGFPQAFLSSMFVLIDSEQKEWQALYYDQKSELSTAFLVDGANITLIPPQQTFKEPQAQVRRLELSHVQLDLAECLRLCAAKQQEKYPEAMPSKIIAILQHLLIGQVYNVTYVTAMLSTLNMKVDAATKEILEAKLIPIISFPDTREKPQ